MKLEKISIKNFRGIRDLITINLKDFNVFVGKNDAGKSTILKALDCTMGGNSCLQEDLNMFAQNAEETEAEIYLEFSFDSLPLVVIDGTVETSFEEEELLDENNKLSLKYEISFTTKIPKTKFSIKRKRYEENCDFLTKTDTALSTLMRRLNLEFDENEEDPINNNRAKRSLIRTYCVENNIPYNFEYGIDSGARMTKIQSCLKNILPRFQYFKADTPLDESDGAIQKHFKKIAKDFLEEGAREIQEEIEENVQTKLDIITKNMNEVFGDDIIKAEPVFDWSKVLETKFVSSREEDLPLKSRGDGFRRIAMMSYFEYLAQEESSERQNIIFGFEEPETFLHPELQEKLQKKLYSVSKNGYQILLTTHSPVIVSKSKIKDVQHITKENNTFLIEPTSKKRISDDLGVNPETAIIENCDIAKAFLFVEGPGDKYVMEYICNIYKENNLLEKNFEELDIKVIPIGGKDEVKNWVNLKLIKASKTPFLIFLDSDKTSADTPPKLFSGHNLLESDDYVFSKKRTLENYISATVIKRILGRDDIDYSDWCDTLKVLSEAENVRYAGRNASKVDFIKYYFSKLSNDEVLNAFQDEEGNDEFIEIYNLLVSKIS